MNPVQLSIFANRLSGLCDEMGAVLRRNGRSAASQWAQCCVAVRSRRILKTVSISPVRNLMRMASCAQAAHIPVHLGSMAYAMRDLVKDRSWREASLLVVNDPYLGGGMGAHAQGAGLSARQTHMTNTLNAPMESLESHYPLRVWRYAIRHDSGGHGKHPGGDGIIRELEFLAPATFTLLTERRRHAPWAWRAGSRQARGKSFQWRGAGAKVQP